MKEKKVDNLEVEEFKKEEPRAEVLEDKNSQYPHDSLKKIEEERTIFWNSYKMHNTLKMVVMMICLVAIVVAFIVIPKVMTGAAQAGVTIVIAVGALGGTYGYSVYVRRKFDRKMKVYFNDYFNFVNDYVFSGKEYKEVELQTPGKITLEEFNENLLFKDVVEAGSRGLTNFKYNGIEMSIVDCAGNIKAEKRMKPVFVGKMLRAKAAYKNEKPIIIYLKGNDRALPPTNLEGIKSVLEDDKMIIYSNNGQWKKTIGPKVIKALEAIKTDKILVDVAVCMYSEKLFVLMGYDDPLMVLPLQTEFDYKPTEVYKKDMKHICNLVEVLNK